MRSTVSAAGPVIGTDAFTVTELGNGVTKSFRAPCHRYRRHRIDRHVHGIGGNRRRGKQRDPRRQATGSGLAGINAALNSGIVYDPHNPQPQTDMVTLTVADSLGHSDSVHFVFNQGGTGPDVALTGTSGKDVIFATGQPTR